MEEEWRDVPKYVGLYQVSNLGRIKSFHNRGKPFPPLWKNTKGYPCIQLCNHGGRKTVRVHTLVATMFIENPSNYPQVNHIDCNKENNNATNLEWCNNSQNLLHAFKNNLISHVGENHPYTKLTNIQVLEIYELLNEGKLNYPEIAKIYSVSRDIINNISNCKTWKHLLKYRYLPLGDTIEQY